MGRFGPNQTGSGFGGNGSGLRRNGRRGSLVGVWLDFPTIWLEFGRRLVGGQLECMHGYNVVAFLDLSSHIHFPSIFYLFVLSSSI